MSSPSASRRTARSSAAEHNVGNNANMLGVSGYILTEPYIRGVDRDKMQSEIITPLSEVGWSSTRATIPPIPSTA